MTQPIAAILALALLRSCAAGERPSEPSASEMNLAAFVEGLRGQGASASLGESVSQPFFAVAGRTVTVNGEAVQAFEYPTEAAAQSDAAKVSTDGSSIGGTSVLWVAPPHFFRKGRVIALYLGDSATVLRALNAVLGPQFAGR